MAHPGVPERSRSSTSMACFRRGWVPSLPATWLSCALASRWRSA